MSTYIWKLAVLTQNLFQAFSSHAQTLRHICYVKSYIHVIYMYIVMYKNAKQAPQATKTLYFAYVLLPHSRHNKTLLFLLSNYAVCNDFNSLWVLQYKTATILPHTQNYKKKNYKILQ